MTAADRPGLTETRGKVASPGLPGATRDACAKLRTRSLGAKKAWRTRKMMALATGRDATCSGCGGRRDNIHDRYCYDCHASYMRRYRRAEGKTSRVTVLPNCTDWLPSASRKKAA